MSIDTGVLAMGYIQLHSLQFNSGASVPIVVVVLFSFFFYHDISLSPFSRFQCLLLIERVERSGNVTTGDNAVTMKGFVRSPLGFVAIDRGARCCPWSGAQSFFGNRFRWLFASHPPFVAVCSSPPPPTLASIVSYSVCRDLCVPMAVTSSPLAFTLFTGGAL